MEARVPPGRRYLETVPRRLLRLALLPALAGALLALALLPYPPLHRLTHELSQLATALGGLTCLGLTARWAGRQAGPASPWPPMAAAMSAGAGLLAVHLVTDGLLAGCHTGPAALFLVVTWVPAAALSTAGGVLLAGRPLRAVLLGAGLFLLAVGHDVGQGLQGLRVVDPFLGPALCIDQRAPMTLDALTLLQRGWLLLVAGTLLALRRRREEPLPAVLLSVALLAATLLGGSHLGLGWGEAAVRAELDATARSEHFEAWYGADGQAALFVDRVLEEAEFQLQLLDRDWPVAEALGGERILLRLHEDDAQVGRLTGFAYPHAWPGGLDLAWPDAFEGTLRHELVHVLQGLVFPEPFLLVDRAGTEGVAEAWEDDLVWLPEAHGVQAAALELGLLPDAAIFSSVFGFSELHEGLAYEASASFFGWLVLEHGWEAFAAWHRSGGDWEAAYGEDIHALDAGWRAFLVGVQVDPRDRQRARRMFDRRTRRAYRDDTCPKLGSPAVNLRRRARGFVEVRDPVAAARDWEAVFARTGVPAHGLAAARQHLLAGEEARAEALLTAVAADPDLAPDEARQLAEVELRAVLQGPREHTRLDAVLQALHEDPAAAALRRLLQPPAEVVPAAGVPAGLTGLPAIDPSVDLRDGLRLALAEPLPRRRGAALLALSDAWPTDPDLALVALELGHLPLPEEVEDRHLGPARLDGVQALLRLAARIPEPCAVARGRLVETGRRAAQHAAWDEVEAVRELLAERCPADPLAGHHAGLLGERLGRRGGATLP